jgi:transposase
MSSAYNHRLRLVSYARQHGIKPTARLFRTTVPTVRKWLRRYQQQGPRGLIERSRAPHHQPGRTSPALEQQVVALRQQLPTFGTRRLIREFDLPLSHRALERNCYRSSAFLGICGRNCAPRISSRVVSWRCEDGRGLWSAL